MIFNLHAGHNPDGKVACGAVGFLKESTEARKVNSRAMELLRGLGHTVYDCTVNDGISQNDVLKKIVSKCNAHEVDYNISFHFNGGGKVISDGVTTGTEIYIYSSSSDAKEMAQRIVNEIAALGFRNRGVKISQSLYFLKKTNAPALLVECCFVDDPDDAALYNPETMAQAIVRGITGAAIPAPAPSAPEPVPAPSGSAFPYQGWITGNDVNVRSCASMNASVVGKAQKGQAVTVWGQESEWLRIDSGKYVHDSLVSRTPPESPAPSPSPAPVDTSWTGRIRGTGVRVRKGPGTGYAVIGSTEKGQTVRVYEERDGWGKVDSGKWISLKYIEHI